MSTTSTNAATDHRRMKRRSAKKSVGLTCRKGTLGLGLNLGIRVQDISVDGIQMLLKSALATGEVVEVVLAVPGLSVPISREATIAWCTGPSPEGFRAGARFRKPLAYDQIFHMV